MTDNYKDKLGTNLKDYFNNQETNEFLWLLITSMNMKQYRHNFAVHGTITSDEHKNLKMSETYMRKFIESVKARLDTKALKKIEERSMKYEIKIIDYYTRKRLYGEWEREMKTIKMPREQYYDWCVEIMDRKCLECKKHHSECSLHELFEGTLIPESSWGFPNCRYAYIKKEE